MGLLQDAAEELGLQTGKKANAAWDRFFLQQLLFHPGAFILKPELILSPAVEARCLQHREAELGANFGASCAGNSDAKSTDRSVSHVHAIFLRSPLMLLNDL